MNNSHSTGKGLGPLGDGARVAVVGGGPGGAGAAIALKNLGQQMGRAVQITLFEGKTFAGETHFNQCVGVLSSPIDKILQDQMGVPFPRHLIQRNITGYVLHSDRRSIILDTDDPPDFSVRRVQFDDYMLEQARARGVEIIQSRVTDLEFHSDQVIVYSESGNCQVDVVVGAFGLDDGTAAVFERATNYRAPHALVSIVTKMHPQPEFMNAFGNRIHAFLPSNHAIEFGAVTPKGNHLTMNIAGQDVDSDAMNAFLHSPAMQAVTPSPQNAQDPDDFSFFKGRFPVSPARGYFGDRFVIVGDASGMVRPFKGKGVNSALLTSTWAVQTMMTQGISAEAFRDYQRACREIIVDLPYGMAMRTLANCLSQWGLLDLMIALAQDDARLRRALFSAVSAHQTYRAIVHDMLDPRWMAHLAFLLVNGLVRSVTNRSPRFTPRRS